MRKLVILIIAVGFFSCKSSKNSASDSEGNLVVRFTSGGNKFDFETQKKFDSFIEDKYPSLKFEQYGYGRDNSREYCITSEGMSSKEFQSFVKDARVILDVSESVVVKENAECIQQPSK